MNITATATEQGLNLLLHHMEDKVRRYVIIGHTQLTNEKVDAVLEGDTLSQMNLGEPMLESDVEAVYIENLIMEALAADYITYERVREFSLLEGDIEAAYYDVDGLLTFTLPLPYELDTNAFIHGIALLGEQDGETVVVSVSKTPKIYKVDGIGGHFTYKVDVRGEAGDIVYTSTLPYACAKQAEEGTSMDTIVSPATMAHVLNQFNDRLTPVLDAMKQSMVAMEAEIKRQIMPVGMTYVQFANTKDPNELFGGTWTNISSKYKDRFFRAEGTVAALFGGVQGDGTRNITGKFYPGCDGDGKGFELLAASGTFAAYSLGANGRVMKRTDGDGFTRNGVDFNASRCWPSGTAVNEVRPINSTIRIWQRVA
jgi:hypothetical protein